MIGFVAAIGFLLFIALALWLMDKFSGGSR